MFMAAGTSFLTVYYLAKLHEQHAYMVIQFEGVRLLLTEPAWSRSLLKAEIDGNQTELRTHKAVPAGRASYNKDKTLWVTLSGWLLGS